MFPGPVFVHELRTVARRKRFYLLRFVFGLFLMYLVWTYASPSWIYFGRPIDQPEYSTRELATIGARLFGGVTWLQAIAVIMLTPALVAGAIGEDRERKVLSYLLASPLSPAEIVLGKLAARLANLASLVMIGLPVISLTMFLGGVEPVEVWLVFLGTMSGLYFLTSLSIFVSTHVERPRDAILVTYSVVACWLFAPLVLQLLNRLPGIAPWVFEARPVIDFLIDSSPVNMLFWSWSGYVPDILEKALWMIGLQLLYGTIMVAWCTFRLRAVEQGSRLIGLPGLGGGRSRETRRLRARRPVGDDPMLWKECAEALSTGSRLKSMGALVLALSFLAGVGYWFYVAGIPAIIEVNAFGYGATSPSSAREAMNIGVRAFTMGLYPISALFVAVMAAASVTSERERDTWISLVATPLEGREIIRGKLLGSFWRIRWLLAAMLLVWLIGLFCGAVHPLGFILDVFATSIYLFSFAALGLITSLSSSSSTRAIATTMGIGLFVNVGYLFCCIPMMISAGSTLFLAGATPFVVIGSLLTFDELGSLLMRDSSDFGQASLFLTCVVSLGLYGSAGLFLYNLCFDRFQILADRPHKGPWPQSEVGTSGIRYLKDDPSDSDGIEFSDSAAENDPASPDPEEKKAD